MQDNIKNTLNCIISRQIKGLLKESEIKPCYLLYEDIGCDSLDIMEIIMSAENKLNIKIPDKDISDIFKVEDLYSLFENAT